MHKNGLDLKKVIETLSGGSAANWSLSNYSPRILKEDYTPGFCQTFYQRFKDCIRRSRKNGPCIASNYPSIETI